MSTKKFNFIAPGDLGDLTKARAEREHRNVSDVLRSALAIYLTGDDEGEALHAAMVRAEDAEAKVKQLEKALGRVAEDLAAARSGVPVRDVRRPPSYRPGRDARAAARDAKDERFAAALQAATRENPVTASRLAALTGFTKTWCHGLLAALGKAGYAEMSVDAGPRTGPGRPRWDWVPVPGKDISEGVRAVKSLVERGQAKAGPRYREGGDLARPVATVRFKPAEGS